MLTWLAAGLLAGASVAVRCQTVGGAFVDAGPELGYVRWGRLGEAVASARPFSATPTPPGCSAPARPTPPRWPPPTGATSIR